MAQIGLGMAVTLAVLLPGVSAAHDWYPYTCCSERDCRPISESEVTAGPDGWTIRSTGEVIGYTDRRLHKTPPAEGPSFHRCSSEGKPLGKTICLFVPEFGS